MNNSFFFVLYVSCTRTWKCFVLNIFYVNEKNKLYLCIIPFVNESFFLLLMLMYLSLILVIDLAGSPYAVIFWFSILFLG